MQFPYDDAVQAAKYDVKLSFFARSPQEYEFSDESVQEKFKEFMTQTDSMDP